MSTLLSVNKKALSLAVVSTSLLLSACVQVSEKGTSENVKTAINKTIPAVSSAWVVKAPIAVKQVPWIQSFNDSALEALVSEALAHNLNLQAAAAGVDKARALAVQAGAALKPNVSLALGAGSSGSVDTSKATVNSGSVGLQVGWEADIWGRIKAGAQGAAASAEAVEADFRYAQYSLAASTINAYVTAIDAKLQTGIAGERLKITEETLRIVKVQRKNGMGSAQDLALAKSDLAGAREQMATSEGAKRNALRSLEVLLGRYPSADLALRNSLPSVPASPPAGIPSELLERRPDLIAAERKVAAAFNGVHQAKAARLPSLSLSGDIGGSSSSLSNILNAKNVAWQLGANLLAPIFDGGKAKQQVKIATAEQKQALAAYAQAALTAFSDVENALDQGVVIDQRQVQLIEVEKESAKAYRIAKLRYEAGETALLDLMQIQQGLVSAKSNLATVQRLAIAQRVNLNLALGGSWK